MLVVDSDIAKMVNMARPASEIEEAWQSLPPSQIVPALADEGVYIASESSFYRILKEAGQLHHRLSGNGKTGMSSPTKAIVLIACKPNSANTRKCWWSRSCASSSVSSAS